ncbi:MAG: hypothetical protein QOJ98_1272 [Acidobacteriota bacterium]|nr:hypothetical protein [Acidobacteriota bacterium]
MRYWLFVFLGLVVCGAAIVGIDWGMYHLMRTGSCASGGPYVSARPCPPGTELHILSLVGGIFGGFIGVGLFAARGRSDTRRESSYPLPLALWTLLFCTLAGSGLYAAFGPAAGDDAPKGTAIFLGLLFIPMGLAPLPFGLAGRKKSAKAVELVQHGKRCRGVVVSVEDTNWTVNNNPRVKITVRAEPDGEPPFTIEKTSVVPRVQIPKAGDTCVVFYDPSDPQGKNGITFDPVPGMTAVAATTLPQAQRLATDLAAVLKAKASPEEEDPLEKIEKLGELRDKGLITPAEFEEQKARLLREV